MPQLQSRQVTGIVVEIWSGSEAGGVAVCCLIPQNFAIFRQDSYSQMKPFQGTSPITSKGSALLSLIFPDILARPPLPPSTHGHILQEEINIAR